MVTDAPLNDIMIMDMARWLGDDARMPVQNLKLVGRCCVALCQHHPRDLLQEWLAQLPQWDRAHSTHIWTHPGMQGIFALIGFQGLT